MYRDPPTSHQKECTSHARESSALH